MLNTMFRDTTLDRLAREMDRLMRAPLVGPASRVQGGAACTPAVNVWHEGDVIIAEAELPGFTMDDIELLVSEDALTLRGRRSSTQPEGATALRRERSLTAFERTLRFPVPLDADRADATLSHGVLRITLPIAEAARPRRIEVKAGSGSALAPAQDDDAIIEEVS